MTDKEIVDALEMAMRNCPLLQTEPGDICSRYAIEAVDGFWRGFIIAMIRERNHFDASVNMSSVEDVR